MQGLMDVANPMPKALEEPKLIAHIETEGKVPRVVQDCRDDAAIGNRARMFDLDAFRGARQVYIMLRRTDVRMIWRSAGVGEGSELRIDSDKGIYASFDLRLQLLIGDLTDDAVPDVTPGEGGRRHQRRTD
jgi:hypothetical protein